MPMAFSACFRAMVPGVGAFVQRLSYRQPVLAANSFSIRLLFFARPVVICPSAQALAAASSLALNSATERMAAL